MNSREEDGYIKAKKKRKGIHSKARTSISVKSKNYKKPYNGQGK